MMMNCERGGAEETRCSQRGVCACARQSGDEMHGVGTACRAFKGG